MPEAEITIQYVNDPKPGKKWGSLKSSEGAYYYGPPAMLKLYQVGEVCKIEFDEDKKGEKAFNQLKRKISSTPQALAKPIPAPPRQRTNPVDQEQMFVVALLKETVMPADTFEILTSRVDLYRKVWRNTFGGSEKQRDDQMNDEISF